MKTPNGRDSMESDQSNDHRQLYLKLHKEFQLLHLIWHRNKNQHQVARWWRRLSMLKRNCAQVVELLQKKVLRKENVVVKLYRLISGLISKQAPKTYRDFNGVIALGQFVTLGVVLVGLLSKIYSIYGQLMVVFENKFRKVGCLDRSLPQKSIEDDGLRGNGTELGSELEDFGEEVTTELNGTTREDSIATSVPSKAKPAEKPSRKKKKNKSKSAIDSIFG